MSEEEILLVNNMIHLCIGTGIFLMPLIYLRSGGKAALRLSAPTPQISRAAFWRRLDLPC
jgi:hypothetical protein